MLRSTGCPRSTPRPDRPRCAAPTSGLGDVDVQLLGGHLGQRGEDALAELDLAGPHVDGAVGADPHPVAQERVGGERRRQRLAGSRASLRISPGSEHRPDHPVVRAAAAQIVVQRLDAPRPGRVRVAASSAARTTIRRTCSSRTGRPAPRRSPAATGCGSPSAPRPSTVSTPCRRPTTAECRTSRRGARRPAPSRHRTRRDRSRTGSPSGRADYAARTAAAVSGSVQIWCALPFTVTVEAAGTASAITPESPSQALGAPARFVTRRFGIETCRSGRPLTGRSSTSSL